LPGGCPAGLRLPWHRFPVYTTRDVAQKPRKRIPLVAGEFTVPDDPGRSPKLLGTRCERCGEQFYPRRVVCAKCLSEQTTNVELGPRGILYSFTFVEMPFFGASPDTAPAGYGVGQIDLPEGPRVQFPLAGSLEDFRVGQVVECELETLREDTEHDVVIVRFRPVGGDGLEPGTA
jgi:uncharacterized OB-fold protein